MTGRFRPDDCVIYRKPKFSARPGPHASGICPAPHGDSYSYGVDKFYRVIAAGPGDEVVVRTRRGRRHTLAADDPALRRARWWERLLWRSRFAPQSPARLASSMAQVLINKGVKAVVAAGWAVNDEAARLFATTFYRKMLEGERFGGAVFQAVLFAVMVLGAARLSAWVFGARI